MIRHVRIAFVSLAAVLAMSGCSVEPLDSDDEDLPVEELAASDLSLAPSATLTCTGRTTPGATAWQPYAANGLTLTINTAGCGFTATPRYFSSLGGSTNHWMTTGASSIYEPTATGFKIYLFDLNAPITPATANARGWHVNWQASADNLRRADLCTGATPAGSTAWQQYDAHTVWTDVSTAACGFPAAPRYVTSIGGATGHWMTTGATSIYIPTATGFRVFVYDRHGPVTPGDANARGWHVNWQAVPNAQRPPSTCSGATPAGTTAWQVYDARGIYVDVNTAACGFTTTPRYATAIGGTFGHWRTTGATSIYQSTPTGFRVYVYHDAGTITPTIANSNNWHIIWEAR